MATATPTISVSATGFAGDQETIHDSGRRHIGAAGTTSSCSTKRRGHSNSGPIPETPSTGSRQTHCLLRRVDSNSFIGDFDGDGDLDGAVRNRDTNIVNVYTNNGDGTLTGPIGRGSAGTAGTPGFFQIGDYDGNGREELLWLYLDGQYAGQVFTKDLMTSATFNMVKANPNYDAFITGDFKRRRIR